MLNRINLAYYKYGSSLSWQWSQLYFVYCVLFYLPAVFFYHTQDLPPSNFNK